MELTFRQVGHRIPIIPSPLVMAYSLGDVEFLGKQKKFIAGSMVAKMEIQDNLKLIPFGVHF